MKTIISLIFVLSSTCVFSQQHIKNADAASFKKLVDEKKSILIDLRTSEEIEKKGMIKGAVQLDFLAKNSEDIIAKLDKKKPYLIYCASGGRSSDCAELMQKMGFTNVTNLEKGFTDWKSKGFDIEMK
jgi:rhodanese-related sulfurtransferase